MDGSFDDVICHLMGFAILDWQAEGEFAPQGQLPPWWSLIDEPSAAGDQTFKVGNRVPFLENFLFDARELWDTGTADRLGSGIWQFRSENGTDLMLEAFAIHTGSRKLLIIQNVTQGGTALEFLQQGRGTQLELLRDLGRRRQLEMELRAGQEQAQRLDRAKTEFVAHVSHEMRTPLTTILGMCELLADSSLAAEQREQLQTLESSANSLLTVVSDLLDVARVEAGTISTRDEFFSPVTLIRRVEKDYRPAAAERGIQLVVTTADNLPEEIFSDSNRLGQILNNLVDNAIKFTDHGTVTLSAGFFDNGPQPVVQFRITDTGVGIDLEQQAAIFNPFVQMESTADQNELGIGLGLAIANRLTDAIAGQLTVTSKPGEGSVFTLAVPINRESAVGVKTTDAAKITEIQPHREAASEVPDSLRILVAEDNPVNRKFISQVLTKSGHRVTAVTNGQQALESIDENSFDVVLMDCQMPVLSGYDAAAAIRAAEADTGRHLPIVAVTAHAMEENRKECERVGIDFFVTKPFKTRDLLEVIQRAAAIRIGA